MTPIFIPHTFIPNQTFRAVAEYFQMMTVYQATRRHIPDAYLQWKDSDRINIRIPAREFEAEIDACLNSIEPLGDIYDGRKGELKNYRPTSIPFYDDASAQNIRSELSQRIKNDQRQPKPGSNRHEQLIHACLFLQIAQNFDANQNAIGQDLAVCAGLEKKLFKNLTGDEDPSLQDFETKPLASTTRLENEHLLPQRLAAWTHLFHHDLSIHAGKKAALSTPIILVTTNRFIFDELTQEISNKVQFKITPDQPIENHCPVSAFFSRLARETDLSSTDPPPFASPISTAKSLETIVIPDQHPLAFLASFTGIRSIDVKTSCKNDSQINTLIGLVTS